MVPKEALQGRLAMFFIVFFTHNKICPETCREVREIKGLSQKNRLLRKNRPLKK